MNKIGFKSGCRTSDHIFKIKTILDKYLKKSKKINACLIDLKKACDSLLDAALFIRLLEVGIGGKFITILRSMYSNIE